MDQPNARGKSAEAHRTEHETPGGRSIDLSLKAVAYVIKKQHWFFCQCTKDGGDYDMHSDFDWTYAGLREKMFKKGGIDVTKTSNGSVRAFVSNKLGKDGLTLTANKQYYKASRKANTKGTKSTYNILKAWLTYPGSREWCTEFPWGKAVAVLGGVGINEETAKKLGLKPELSWKAPLNNERGAEMQWWLICRPCVSNRRSIWMRRSRFATTKGERARSPRKQALKLRSRQRRRALKLRSRQK
jgi:hypothetical protein